MITIGKPVLEVEDLVLAFGPDSAGYRPVNGATFTVRSGEILGVVGESGCGKSLTMAAVLGLLPDGGRVASGSIRLHGEELTTRSARGMAKVRGMQVTLVPSDAGAALNPVERVWRQASRAYAVHASSKPHRSAEMARVVSMLRRVSLSQPEKRARRYPHELSGGMQQRVAIAMGLQNGPRLLIADEPTTALDVTVQAQILKLLLEVREREGTAIVLITHDLTTVAEICDTVVVMYAGRVVEEGPVSQVCGAPQHPYTQALIASIPVLGGEPLTLLQTIPGSPPLPDASRHGCMFRERCQTWRQYSQPEVCVHDDPRLTPTSSGQVACHLAGLPGTAPPVGAQE